MVLVFMPRACLWGIRNFRLKHILRLTAPPPQKCPKKPHTWATWHVMHGTSLQELMKLGGRKSYEMVLRYAHLAPEHLADATSDLTRRYMQPQKH